MTYQGLAYIIEKRHPDLLKRDHLFVDVLLVNNNSAANSMPRGNECRRETPRNEDDVAWGTGTVLPTVPVC